MSGEDKLRALRDALHPGTSLDELQWLELRGILNTILDGYDVRENYSIPVKRGPRPRTQAFQKWMVIQFLKECADDPGNNETHHLAQVAFWWGKSPKQLAKLVRELRVELEPIAKTMTIEAIETTARILQPEYKKVKRG